jgi:hypothetical protein
LNLAGQAPEERTSISIRDHVRVQIMTARLFSRGPLGRTDAKRGMPGKGPKIEPSAA